MRTKAIGFMRFCGRFFSWLVSRLFSSARRKDRDVPAFIYRCNLCFERFDRYNAEDRDDAIRALTGAIDHIPTVTLHHCQEARVGIAELIGAQLES
jgi:hypothetical protein